MAGFVAQYPFATILFGLSGISAFLTWFEGIGKTPFQYRYQEALDEGRLDPGIGESRYEELEWKYGSHRNYKSLLRGEKEFE